MTVFTRARQLSLSWASLIQSTHFHPLSLRFIWMLSSHLRLRLSTGLYVQFSQPKRCVHISCFPCMPHTSPISSFWLDHPSNLVSSTNHPVFSILSSFLHFLCTTVQLPGNDAPTSQRGDMLRHHQQVHAVTKLCKSTELWRGTCPARSSRFVRCGSLQMLLVHILYRSSHKTPCCNISSRVPCSGIPCYAVYSENIV